MSIVRTPRKSHWTVIQNNLARNKNLSFEARGMMVYLLSHADNWRVSAEDIEREGGIGRERRQRVFRELEAEGYLSGHRKRHEGRYLFEIWVHDEPLPEENRTFELGMGAKAAKTAKFGEEEAQDQSEASPGTAFRVPGFPVAGAAGSRESRSSKEILNQEITEERKKEGESADPAPESVFDVPRETEETEGQREFRLMAEILTAQTRSENLQENVFRIEREVVKLRNGGFGLKDVRDFANAKGFQKLGFYYRDFLDWKAANAPTDVAKPLEDKPRPGCDICRAEGTPGYVIENGKARRCECNESNQAPVGDGRGESMSGRVFV